MKNIASIQYSNYDAIVVGARCAGSATAMLLAQQGARVLLVDREPRMHDTLSTHALMRPAVSMLSQWGLLPQIIESGAAPVTHTRFIYGSETVDVPIESDELVPSLFAPRRWVLDRILRDAAVAAGAELHCGMNFESLKFDSDGRAVAANLRKLYGNTQTIKADMIVGADGLRSSVALAAGARAQVQSDAKSATVYTYIYGVPNEGYRWYYANGKAAGLIPTNDGAHCLFASTSRDLFSQTFGKDAYSGAVGMLSGWEPKLGAKLAFSGPAEPTRRFLGSTGFIRECAGPGWALVGDAGYFKDPASAHGISDAFLDAARLANAFIQSPELVTQYQADRDKHATEIFRISQEMASLSWDLDELKMLHLQLAKCMKAEAADLPSNEFQNCAVAA